MKKKYKVLIMKCDDYDPDRISGIIREGMGELGVKPFGRILMKPNVVIAHPRVFPHAFTRSEFLDGVIPAVKSAAENVKELAVGERSGLTIPTRWAFKQAGYPRVLRKHRVKAHYFDETRQLPVHINGDNTLRNRLFMPKPIVDCDFLVNLPKFKAHPWTKLTLSLKNFIGIQDDRHRLVDHNQFLEHKISDLQKVIQPKFIAVDAISAGQKTMLTPTPFPMGAIVMGTNSCAVDTVGCHMIHLNPDEVNYLCYTSQKGLGPMDLDEIEVAGDFPLEEVREKTTNFQFCLEHIDHYFKDAPNLTCTVGKFPEEHSPDYCWGGCPGALQETMHILNAYYPNVYQEMKKIHYVVGKVDGPIEFNKDEKILFVGDCTSWKGNIDGKEVNIKSRYKTCTEVDESKTKSNDLLLKHFTTLLKCFWNTRSRYIRATGCTASVADHVHYISFLGKTGNPNFDRTMIVSVAFSYLMLRFQRIINCLLSWK